MTLLVKNLIRPYHLLMKNLILFALLSFATLTHAQTQKKFGAGILIGNPTSLSAKYWTEQNRALQGGLAFDLDDYILIHGDYLVHYPGTFKTTESFINSLVPYVGIGGLFVITTDDRRKKDDYLGEDSGSIGLGVRVPFGIEWRNPDPSIGVFLELVPGISVIPETSALFMGGIGVRYYF